MFPDCPADSELVAAGVGGEDVTLVSVKLVDAELLDVEVSCSVVWYAVTVVPLPCWQL